MLRWDADSETVSVHRVVQQILRDRIGDDTARWVKHSAELLNAVLPDAPGDVRAWKRWEPLRPHVAAAIEHADQAGIAHPTSRLMNQLAQLLYAKALYPQAEPLMRRSLAIDEATYGPDDPEVATRLSNLAGLMLATNRLAPAEPLLRRALAIDEAHYGPDNPEVAIDLNNLAQLLMDTDRLGEAEPLMRRALAIDEAHYGSDSSRVAIHLSNLAQLLMATDRLREAEPLMRVALAIDEANGPDHPDVASGCAVSPSC